MTELKVGDRVVISNGDRDQHTAIIGEIKTHWIVKTLNCTTPSIYSKRTLKAYGANSFSAYNTYFLRKAN